MNTRLQPLNLTSFVGGLNARRSSFTLAEDESPDMLNIEVDPRAGFYTRRGWERWNQVDVMDPSLWQPRLAKQHLLASGTFDVYVSNDIGGGIGEVWRADASGMFANTGIECNAVPHLADFSMWGDDVYIATGRNAAVLAGTPYKVESGTPVPLADATLAFNDDYTVPVGGRMPFADHAESHAGYLFVAATTEGGVQYPNRIRWSHPNYPEDWATLDFLDINIGGGHITGLLSFRDHLLIFKTDSVWALYGYDLESWQLVQVSTAIGCPQPGSITRSESAAFFYSASDRGGFYAYSGGGSPVHISEKIRTITETVTHINDVWVEWTGRRLWCITNHDALVFDPEIGDGSWVRHRPALGSLGPVVKRSDIDSEYPLACINGDSGAACLLRLDYRTDSYDVILEDYSNVLFDGLTGDRLTDRLNGAFIANAPADVGSPFDVYYRTGWLDVGWPDRRKSWRRPRFLIRKPSRTVGVRADAFHDYDETTVRRSRTGYFQPDGSAFWTAGGAADPSGLGFDWGDGTHWGEQTQGGELGRIATGLGVSRSLQIRVSADPSTPGAPFAFDGLFLKYIARRFTT